MTIRPAFISVAAGLALAGCASSPYIDPPNLLSAEDSPVWTAGQRTEFVESITPGETTLGEVVAMHGPAMAYQSDASGRSMTAKLIWYGETGLDQPWGAVVVPGSYRDWSNSSPVLAVYNSEGMRRDRSAARTQGTGVAAAEAPAPVSASAAPSGTQPAGEVGEAPAGGEASTAAMADGRIGPEDVSDELAAEMAAFGEAGAPVSEFRVRFGNEAEYDEDRRMFRKVGSALFYGSEYGGGPSIWVEFDGDDRYESTMIHIPRGGNSAPYERFF